MVHARDYEPVAQVVRHWLDLKEVLGSNPIGVVVEVLLMRPNKGRNSCPGLG